MEIRINDSIAGRDETILITGANGFIGSKLVQVLLEDGFQRIRCLVRSSARAARVLARVNQPNDRAGIELVEGNLLSHQDCAKVTRGATVIFHLAAARGEKSVADAVLNSVVTTRNLLDATIAHGCVRRFVNVSSFAIYSNEDSNRAGLLDETCTIEARPSLRGDAYCFAKSKQEAVVHEYGSKFSLPYVVVRPGHVYGPGNLGITGRVGINTFGIFLHLGGNNPLPLTYVDNCAQAVALAGLRKLDRNGEIFNVVDDDLPSSSSFLHQYKSNVGSFRSIFLPHVLSYALCRFWEWYSTWSQGQLEPVFNRKRWNATWKKTHYSNEKLKVTLGWRPRVSTEEGLARYFAACRRQGQHA